MDIVLSIITVNYNGLAYTCALIDTIPFGSLPMEVIVVDNGSAQDEASQIAAKYPNIRTIRSKKNLGFAGGNNLGIQAAKGRYIYLVNNDTEFPSPWNVEAMIKRLESSVEIGVVCPKIRFSWSTKPIQFAGYTPLSAITLRNHALGYGEEDHGQHDVPHPTPYAHGAAMMLKREVVEKAGLMPECYFLYYEELDWSLQIRHAGFEIWYDPCSTIYHKESKTTGQDSALRTYYVCRNRLLFARRNISGIHLILCYIYIIGIVSIRDMLKYLLKGRTDLLKAILRGIRDFIKMR